MSSLIRLIKFCQKNYRYYVLINIVKVISNSLGNINDSKKKKTLGLKFDQIEHNLRRPSHSIITSH